MRLNQIFFDEFEGGTGGGGAGGNGEGAGSGAPPAAPARVSLDPESIKQFSGVIAEQFKQNRPPEGPKTYTPEEIATARKNLKFWEPDDAFITEFGNLETQKPAFLKMRDGLMAQFMEIQKAMLAEQETKWNSRFEPVQTLLEARNQQEQEERFGTAYPSLANPKLRGFRDSVGQQLLASGAFKGKSESEAFALLANAMADAIKEVNPTFSLETPVSNNSRSVRSGNGITPTPHGSGGGGSGGSNGEGDGGAKLPKAASLFSKIRG